MSHRRRPIAVTVGLVAAALASARSGIAQKAPASASTAASSASAAPPAPAPPQPSGPMLDIVRLKDGSFVRGTILEHGATTRTVIETRTGTRTFEAAEVVYAGLATRDPGGATVETAPAASTSAAPPAASAVPMDKKVHFRADGNGVQIHAVALGKGAATAGKLEPLCVAPCDVALERGAYRLALGHVGQTPLYTRENVELKEGSTVEGRLLSRKTTRTAGWAIVGLSTVPIVYGLARGFTSKGSDRGIGFVVAVVGLGTMGAGFVITRAQDVAEAEVAEEKKEKSALGPPLPTSRPWVVGLGGQF